MLSGIVAVISLRNVFSLTTGFCLFLLSVYNLFPGHFIDYSQYYRGIIIKQEECEIPKLDPYDTSILSLLQKAEKLTCKRVQEDFVQQKEHEFLEISKKILEKHGRNSTKCQYRCYRRKDNDFELGFDEWTDFSATRIAKPNCEFTEVECKKSYFPYTTVYNDNFAHIPKAAPYSGARKYDVIIMVIDSLSHSSALRNLPKTIKVLQDLYGNFVLNGLTKVGDNSFPNAAAFLTGKRVRVNGYTGELPDDMAGATYDDWPIIWKNFSNQGYKTFYAEDYSDFNLFAYLANGFTEQPVDHYFRPYWLNVYKSYLHRRSTQLCYGSRKMHNIQLDYLSQFLNAYSGHPKFVLNWLTEIGHDFMHMVNVADEDLSKFFKDHHPLLKDSFLFIMGDHGHRFDAIRRTLTGRLEERLPLVSIHLPNNLKSTRPDLQEAMQWNLDRLTSFFDIHATLEHILMENQNEWLIEKRKPAHEIIRGLNLMEKIPRKRTCAEAGVPEEFCVCQMEVSIDPANSMIKEGAEFLVSHITKQISKFSACTAFQLEKIYYAQRVLPNKRALLSGGSLTMGEEVETRFRVAIRVQPAAADFEALIKFDQISSKYEVIGDVNRINKYGQAGDCIDRVNLRKFCHCQVNN